jgi:hypothetical protein
MKGRKEDSYKNRLRKYELECGFGLEGFCGDVLFVNPVMLC